MDEVSGRLNTDERGTYLGNFDTGDSILVLYKEGSYEITDFELGNRFDPNEIIHISQFAEEDIISAIYYDGHKNWTLVKRFKIETNTQKQRFSFITDHKDSKLYFATADHTPQVRYTISNKGKKEEFDLDITEFIDVKGWKALGNKLAEQKLLKVEAFSLPASNGEQGALFDE